MPTDSRIEDARPAWRRYWPEVLLGLFATVTFLGCLGSVDLWGKREQRAAAEAIDTADHGHWLIAEIQHRPRLEKPPLPRWSIAALMTITGRRDEWIVRLPCALCALATVALVYALGRRLGGRSVGLASALILATSGFYVGEMRQAGHDGFLALFTTLALYAAWRLLEGEDAGASARPRAEGGWRLVFALAVGMGFLSKGPIILMLTMAAIVPYLIQARRLVDGLRRLIDGPGLLLFVVLAACWPAAVLWQDPQAWGVWQTEITEKTGFLGILTHRHYALLARDWPAMPFPWSIVAMAALVVPFLPREARGHCSDEANAEGTGRGGPSPCWYAWWWAVGNMAILCCWSVARPSYYVPCVPGLSILAGWTWVRLSRRAQDVASRGARVARVVLQSQWVLIFVTAVAAPFAARPWMPGSVWPWTFVVAAVAAVAVVASVSAWRRGAEAVALAPIGAAWAVGILVVYGQIAPAENARRSHRELARTLSRLVSHDAGPIYYFNELDEGLWFYLPSQELMPVPGTQPRYSTAHDLAVAYRTRRDPSQTVEELDMRRESMEKQSLLAWLDDRGDASPYLLIRSSLYDRYAADLAGRATPVLRESGLGRNELVLLRGTGHSPVTAAGAPVRR